MIRFIVFSIITALTLIMAWGGLTGIFGGVALLAVTVAGFGLLVGVCTEIVRET